MQKRLTQGPVMPTMLRFAVPMILGDLLQQCYNIADTLVVGRFIGTNALAAVGSAFTLMTFLTSILLGLAMGSGTVFSIKFGQKDDTGLREGVLAAFVLLAIIGVNMVRESFGGDEKLDDDYSAKAMLPLAVATSIDAFAVGVSFAAMQVNILPAAGLIGCITCLLSAIGVRVGALFGDKYRAPSERIGGIVLILIGLKTLLTGLGIL